jgi:hypothetical protein
MKRHLQLTYIVVPTATKKCCSGAPWRQIGFDECAPARKARRAADMKSPAGFDA